MPQYNMVKNGLFYSNTASGVGNKSLSWSQLESLMEGTTTSGGITVSGADVLCLDLDMSQRIKIDSVRLYASDLSQMSNVKFYYKNNVEDSYITISTVSGALYYYGLIPAPSAPRYIRTVVSGVSMSIYEFEVLNNDVIVSFGINGEDYASYIDDAPIGSVGASKSISIYNNSSDPLPADAYVCVDRTGNAADFYVEISSGEEGTYYDLTDGAMISDNNSNSTYTWNMGSFSNTVVDGTNAFVKLTSFTYLGTVPLITPTYSFRVAEHCWDYDRVNDKMYAIGSDGILKLWEYKHQENTWSYIGEVKPGSTGHVLKATMCYMNGYVYCLVDGNTTFGRYNLSGAVNNWEALTSPTVGSGTYYRRNIVSDRDRYLYCITNHVTGGVANSFLRYDTTASGWATMNSGYALAESSSDWGVSCSLAYDNDNGRKYVYALVSNGGQNLYIQRYDVDGNSWNTIYLSLTAIVGAISNLAFIIMTYYNGNIWFAVSNYANKIYRYNIDTATAYTYTNAVFTFWSAAGNSGDGQYPPHFIALPGSRIYAAHFQADRTKYSGYGFITASGAYTTPIFSLDNAYNASYLTDESVTASGTTSVSYNANSYNGSIRVKSSNTAPLVANEVYYSYTGVGLRKLILYNNTMSLFFSSSAIAAACVDRRSGYVATVAVGGTDCTLFILNRSGTVLYSFYSGGSQYPYYWNVAQGFDKVGGLWGYGSSVKNLYHMSSSLVQLGVISQSGADFIHDMVPEWDGEGCWYTDKTINVLYHVDRVCGVLHSIALRQPRNLCATTDNGCWVVDNTDLVAKRYNSSGVLVKTIVLGRTASSMTHDFTNGFWYASSNYIYHVTSEGVEDVATLYDQPNRVYGTVDGCVVHRNISGNYYIHFIDYVSKSITRSYNIGASTSVIGVYSLDVETDIQYKMGTSVIPASYDPVWSSVSGSLQWQEVRKDGYFLPKNKYIQAEYTLRTTSTNSPELHSIIMAPAIKVEDIQPDSYKNAYIRTNIPEGVDIADYEARLKAWWGKEE